MINTAVLEPTAPAAEARRALDTLLRQLVAMGGSDLHLTAGIAPCVRVDGQLARLPGLAALSSADTEGLARAAVSEPQWSAFDLTRELDTSYSVPGVSRFRLNAYHQRGSVGMVFRAIPFQIPALEDLGLPLSIERFAHLQRGLVLITGPTGSGKSTTMASLLDVANRTRAAHIVTIEDPIEYLHAHQKSVVNQREVGTDTADFSVALKHVLRQDPDIILVGELRDLETTSVAITAAETGHLVLATLHTQSAAQTIDRLIDIFPAHQQSQIRSQLANCLQGVITQALAPRRDGSGRTPICEVLIASPAVRSLIREGKVHQIPTVMQSSGELGMVSFDQSLANSYGDLLISKHTALELAHDPDVLQRLARF